LTQVEKHEVRLIQRAARGNAEAFTTLFYQHFQPIYNFALSLCNDPAQAEDITQETFIRAHANLKNLGPPWNLRAWLFRLTCNLFIDATRRQRPEEAGDEGNFPLSGGPDPEKSLMQREIAERVRHVLQSLPTQSREILELREVHGFSYAEITEIMDISLSNVKVMLHRARIKFQEAYGVRLLVEEPTEDCPEVSVLMHALHDGEALADKERLVREHLKVCDACQKRRRWLVTQSGLLGALVPVAPPSDLGERILEEIGVAKATHNGSYRERLRSMAPGGGVIAILLAAGWGLYAAFGSSALPSAEQTPPGGVGTPGSNHELLESLSTQPANVESNYLSVTPDPLPVSATTTPNSTQSPTVQPNQTFTDTPTALQPTATPTPDITAPKVSGPSALPNPAFTTSPVTVSATVNDLAGIASVMLYYKTGKGTYQLAGPMMAVGGGIYSLTISPLTPAGDYDYRILAIDNFGNATCNVKNLADCPGGTFEVILA
jgi:RNA polymerase sigma-70 factor (ECF subfamily)